MRTVPDGNLTESFPLRAEQFARRGRRRTGCCFHNGARRGGQDKRPRRSFEMRRQRLFDQFGSEEPDCSVPSFRALSETGDCRRFGLPPLAVGIAMRNSPLPGLTTRTIT